MTDKKQEQARFEAMHTYEKKYLGMGYKLICGTDEAGRGPLAGPVCAAAVILPFGGETFLCNIEGLNDSKKLTEKKRTALDGIIREKAYAIGVAMISPKEIDETNILRASLKAMKLAVQNLTLTAAYQEIAQSGKTIIPDILLVDGDKLPETGIESVLIISGDALSVSIAAASIIAKVARDEFMKRCDEVYPQYGFAKHKGYGTKEHIAAIGKHGICPIHRHSFIKQNWFNINQ